MLTRDFEVMDRDRRLTGWLRGQVDRPIAPAGFEYSNGWRVRGYPERRYMANWTTGGLTYNNTGREELALEHAQNTLNSYALHILPLCIYFSGLQLCYKCCFFPNTKSFHPNFDILCYFNEHTSLCSLPCVWPYFQPP
jgi:hypothetical protein